MKKNSFFLSFNIIILVLVVGGFGANAFVNTEKLPPASILVYLHGVILFGWYFLMVMQANLIQTDNYALHSILGKMSIFLAFGIIITGIMMTLDSYYRSKNIPLITVNTLQLINFIILYSLALYQRKSPARHKRFILLASLAILLPALSRITSVLDLNDSYALLLLLLLLIILLVYDLKILEKIHKATALGMGIILIGFINTIGLIASESCAKWLESILF